MPIGSGVMRYSPCALVTSVTSLTCKDGLLAVTVTPGSTPPLSSRTWPRIADACWAMAAAGTANHARSAHTNNFRTFQGSNLRINVSP